MPEKIIEELNVLKDEYYQLKRRRSDLFEQQEKALYELIEKYKSVYEWIRKGNFYFGHPYLDFSSARGPVLGYDDHNSRMIVYDLSKRDIVKTDVGKKYREDDTITMYQLVEEGYFNTAVSGLTYFTDLLKRYNGDLIKRISELEEQIANLVE